MKIGGEIVTHTKDEQLRHKELGEVALSLMPRYGHNWHRHSLVALGAASLSRILYYNELYKKILEVPGVICEFGVQWGATLSQLIALRSIYEPFNRSRQVFGFDTFSGFLSVDSEDGGSLAVGDCPSEMDYKETLEKILALHESFSPQPHIKKFSLIEGDAIKTIDEWLEKHNHAIIAMAIFDMCLYKPTKEVLQKIIPRLTKGSVLVFDELNRAEFPGETQALNEVLGLNKLSLRRSAYQPYCAWAVFDG